jgi:hypothetical protein
VKEGEEVHEDMDIDEDEEVEEEEDGEVDDRFCEPPKEYVETHEGMPLELEHVLLTSMRSQGYLPLPSGRQTAGLLHSSQEGRGTYFHNYIFSQLFIPIFSYRFLVAYFHNHIFS